jgi:uncharacterized membrane protein
MQIILTESQMNRLLLEERNTTISNILKNSENFTRQIVRNVKKAFSLDFKFLSTFGSVIGGFTAPIHEFLSGNYPTLDDKDISLICFGIIMMFFSENEEKTKKVIEIIKQKGLRTYFRQALYKSQDLKKAFIDFLESLGISLSNAGNAFAFAFIIPFFSLIYDIAKSNGDISSNVEMLVKTVLSYGIVVGGSETLRELFTKIIKRFRSQ